MRKNLGSKTYIYPQPVLIIGTYDENGKANAMNAAWGGIADDDQVMVCLGSHRTTDNIAKTNAFTVGIPVVENTVAADYVGIVSGRKEPDKIAKAGWTETKAEFVNAPVFNEIPLCLECELVKIVDDDKYIGRIVNVSVDEAYLAEDGLIDLNKFVPITYDPIRHNYIALGRIVGKAFSDGKKIK